MRYFLIRSSSTSENVALVFHEYQNSYSFVRSKSEAFRRAFEGAKNSIDYTLLVKEGDCLLHMNYGVDNPTWCETVLKKTCGSYWEVFESKELDMNMQVDDLIKSFLA